MKVRVLVGGLCAWALCTANPASAQGIAGGETATLPTLGVSFTLPSGSGEWVARKDAGGDVLQRTRPVNPYLSVLLNVPDGESSCAEQLAGLAKKGLAKLDRPSLVPAGFDSQLLSASNNGESLIAFCAEAKGRVLVALVTYAAAPDGDDLATVVPVLAAVADAALATSAPPPVQEDLEPQRFVLPSSGLVLVVSSPSSWMLSKGKNNRDLLVRSVPADPELSVGLEVLRTRRKVGCGSILEQHMTATQRGELEDRPPYLPDGWHGQVALRYSNGKGRALACAELPAGFLLATITYSGSLDDKDALQARPVLAAALAAGSATVVEEKKKPGGLFGGDSFRSPEFFLAGQRVAPVAPEDDAPSTPDYPNSLSGLVGVRQAGMLRFSRTSAFGLSGRYVLSGGWDLEHGLVIDGIIALGIGLTVDRISLMPMVGQGGDSIGSDDEGTEGVTDAKLRMPFEFFTYYGGVVVAQITPMVALEGSFGYCDRGPIRELRGEGRVMVLPRSFRKVSVGVVWSDIETVATSTQVVLGIGF